MTLVAADVAAAADNRRCSNLPAPMNETWPTRISQRRQPKSPFQSQRMSSGSTTPFVGIAANVAGAARPAINFISNDHPQSPLYRSITLDAAAVAAATDKRRCSNLPAPMNETRATP